MFAQQIQSYYLLVQFSCQIVYRDLGTSKIDRLGDVLLNFVLHHSALGLFSNYFIEMLHCFKNRYVRLPTMRLARFVWGSAEPSPFEKSGLGDMFTKFKGFKQVSFNANDCLLNFKTNDQ